MTLQERYDQKRKDAEAVGCEYQQIQQRGGQLQQEMIRIDAELGLLETLMREAGETPQSAPIAETLTLVKPRKPRKAKPESAA